MKTLLDWIRIYTYLIGFAIFFSFTGMLGGIGGTLMMLTMILAPIGAFFGKRPSSPPIQ